MTRLRQRAERLQPDLPNVRQIHLALFSGRPIEQPELLAAIQRENILTYTVDDLYNSS